jgi:hypothetical protein
MSVQNTSPEAMYLTKPNIVHPDSTYATGTPLATEGERRVLADEVRGRADIATRKGVTVTGGAIKRGK